jgi:hypothetical protein
MYRRRASIYCQQPQTAAILCVVRYQAAGSAHSPPRRSRNPSPYPRARRADVRNSRPIDQAAKGLHEVPALTQAQAGKGRVSGCGSACACGCGCGCASVVETRRESIDDWTGPSSLFLNLSRLCHVNSPGNFKRCPRNLRLNGCCIDSRRDGCEARRETDLNIVRQCHFPDVPGPLLPKARQFASTAARLHHDPTTTNFSPVIRSVRFEGIDLQGIALHDRIADQITSLPLSAHSVSSR